jgi:hypothetical protein
MQSPVMKWTVVIWLPLCPDQSGQHHEHGEQSPQFTS